MSRMKVEQTRSFIFIHMPPACLPVNRSHSHILWHNDREGARKLSILEWNSAKSCNENSNVRPFSLSVRHWRAGRQAGHPGHCWLQSDSILVPGLSRAEDVLLIMSDWCDGGAPLVVVYRMRWWWRAGRDGVKWQSGFPESTSSCSTLFGRRTKPTMSQNCQFVNKCSSPDTLKADGRTGQANGQIRTRWRGMGIPDLLDLAKGQRGEGFPIVKLDKILSIWGLAESNFCNLSRDGDHHQSVSQWSEWQSPLVLYWTCSTNITPLATTSTSNGGGGAVRTAACLVIFDFCRPRSRKKGFSVAKSIGIVGRPLRGSHSCQCCRYIDFY